MLSVNLTGFIPDKPLDAINLQVEYQRLSQIEADHETIIQFLSAGPSPARSCIGSVLETKCNFKVMKKLNFKPSVEHFLHHDNYYLPVTPSERPKCALEAGFVAVVSLGQFLGTSLRSFYEAGVYVSRSARPVTVLLAIIEQLSFPTKLVFLSRDIDHVS